MTKLPFFFKGKIIDAFLILNEKQKFEEIYNKPEYKLDARGRIQPTKHKTIVKKSGKMSGKDGLKGEKFFQAWDMLHRRK